ncbi:MAG: regulatory protein RecX [Burkholderiales bacterium]
MDNDPAHTEALRMLARRELSTEGVRSRLEDRGFGRDEIEDAIARLLASGALDDARAARAYARTATNVKGRGRLRVMRELLQMGIHADIASEALGEVFGELDERALIARALQKKLRGRAKPGTPAEHARLYQYLMRQGFSPAGVTAALRRLRSGRGAGTEEE